MRLLVAFFLIALAWWPDGAPAQTDALVSAYRQCNTLRDQGRYGNAEPFCLKALKQAETEFGSLFSISRSSPS